MALLDSSSDLYMRLLRLAALLCLLAIGQVVFTTYRKRSHFRKLMQKHGIETIPGHSWIFGHLATIGKVMSKYPSDTAGVTMPHILLKKYPQFSKAGALYLDLWPVSYPLLVVYQPDMMAQFCQNPSQLKHPLLRTEFHSFTKGKDLVTSEGQQWKKWRSTFNPGFSNQNILSLVPAFLEEMVPFKKYLSGLADSGETVPFQEQAMKATCDVIGRAVLGVSLKVQTVEYHPIYATLKDSISWLITDWSPKSIPRLINPLRPFVMARDNKILDDELRPLLKAELSKGGHAGGSKTIVSLAVDAYAQETGNSLAKTHGSDDFVDTTIEHMKMFLFAGHDTTATTLSYVYFSLHQSPDTLAKVRAEHDEILGSDPLQASEIIAATPALLNQLPYTLAVIKETLRMFPPVGSARAGGPDLFLTNPVTGQQFPTEGMVLLSSSFAMQRHPDVWDDAETFKPERWLHNSDDEQRLRNNAWRPFELGPRSCIGQGLSVTEMKMILALTVREFDIIPMYKKDAQTLNGNPAYQHDGPGSVTTHPKDGMPVMVKRRI